MKASEGLPIAWSVGFCNQERAGEAWKERGMEDDPDELPTKSNHPLPLLSPAALGLARRWSWEGGPVGVCPTESWD